MDLAWIELVSASRLLKPQDCPGLLPSLTKQASYFLVLPIFMVILTPALWP